jgi:N-glycosylase/DNA lyase
MPASKSNISDFCNNPKNRNRVPSPAGLSVIALPPWPFDLAATLNSGQVFHWQEWNGGFVGLIGDQPILLQQPDARTLLCPGGKEKAAMQYLGLDHDLTTISSAFPANDLALARALAWCPGLRLIRQPKWECLATFITSSLKQVAHIRQMSLALRRRFGTPVIARGLPIQYSYPTAEAIAAAGEPALRECGLGYRATFLHRAASDIAAGRVDLGAISRLPDADALEALCRLHGVGEKVASCALLFAWERYGVFPVDVWIERVLRELYFPRRRKVTARKIREFAWQHFGPWRGYAQQFLFHWARLTGCGTKRNS